MATNGISDSSTENLWLPYNFEHSIKRFLQYAAFLHIFEIHYKKNFWTLIMPKNKSPCLNQASSIDSVFSQTRCKPSNERLCYTGRSKTKLPSQESVGQAPTLTKAHLLPTSPTITIFPKGLPQHRPSMIPCRDANMTTVQIYYELG